MIDAARVWLLRFMSTIENGTIIHCSYPRFVGPLTSDAFVVQAYCFLRSSSAHSPTTKQHRVR